MIHTQRVYTHTHTDASAVNNNWLYIVTFIFCLHFDSHFMNAAKQLIMVSWLRNFVFHIQYALHSHVNWYIIESTFSSSMWSNFMHAFWNFNMNHIPHFQFSIKFIECTIVHEANALFCWIYLQILMLWWDEM